MNLKLWLKALFFPNNKARKAKPRSTTKLNLEQLEPRLVPTTFTTIGSGNWRDPTIWSGGSGLHVAPIGGDTVVITSGKVVTIPSGESDNAATLIVGDSGGAGTLDFAAGSYGLNVTGDVTLGYSGNNGTVDMTNGGSLTIGGAFNLTAS